MLTKKMLSPEWLVNTSTALIAVIIMNCWVGIPFNMLLLVSGLTSISPDVYELQDCTQKGRLNRLYVGTIQKCRNAMVLLQGQELRLVSSIRNGLSEKCCHVQQESVRCINWHLHAI